MSTNDPRNSPTANFSIGGASSPQANVTFGEMGAAPTGVPTKDISTAEFMPEVIEASNNQPVVVDFWAPWCGPCKQLTPIIEKVVAETNGAVKLVKMNIEDHPEIAGQMGVQSIPAVVAFKGGRPAEAFMGAKPESEVREFIRKVAGEMEPSPLDQALEQAKQMVETGETAQACAIYGQILQQVPDNVTAICGLGNLYLEANEIEKAELLLEQLSENQRSETDVVSLVAAIELAKQADDLGEVGELMALVEQEPNNHQARFDLSIALNSINKRQDAADQLLEIMKADRSWNEDGAKTQLLQFFDAWGFNDESTVEARRKLSSLLFS